MCLLKKRTLVNCLVIFVIAAILLTYLAFQIQDSNTPRVYAETPTSGSILTSGSATATLTYDTIWEYRAPGALQVESVAIVPGSAIQPQNLLLTFENESVRAALATAREEAVNYKNQMSSHPSTSSAYILASWNLSKKEKAIQELEKLLENNGSLYSEMNGETFEINVVGNTACQPGDVLLKICNTTKDAVLTWIMPDDLFDSGDRINAPLKYLSNNGKVITESVSIPILSRRYIRESGQYEFTARIRQKEGEELKMSNYETVSIQLRKEGEVYDTILPISAVTLLNDTEGEIFSVIWNSDREIYTVRSSSVQILDNDGTSVAVERKIQDPVVIYSDRPLTSGMEVKVEAGNG